MKRTLIVVCCAMVALMLVSAGAFAFVGVGVGITKIPVNQKRGNSPPPVACSNQLVFDYSNSCALIGQAWGQ
jgi:hypothetical protein